MLSEHNPIAELITQIQTKWTNEVSPFPELRLVRWFIKPEEARLYEGFLKLESTEHGAIPEVLVAMLTPFKTEASYSIELIRDWTTAFKEDIKTHEKLSKHRAGDLWNPGEIATGTALGEEYNNRQLLHMLSSFHRQMVDKDMRMVIALLPNSIYDMEGFNRWLRSFMKIGLPEALLFMVFDHIGENYFESVFEKYPDACKSLHINLDLDGAVSKIAKMGNSNSPEVKFRECVLEMGQAVQKKNQASLDLWGEKALQVTQKSGLKSLYASAHIVYAGMLFNFKEFKRIDALLAQGLVIAQQGLKNEDAACKPLVIQYYGYIAASNQLQNKIKEAISGFEKQGDTATDYQLPGMALTPYRQAYMLSKKSLPHRYDELIQKAFTAGQSLSAEEQLHSGFSGIGYDFFLWNQSKQKWDEAEKVDYDMKEIFGSDWKEKAKIPGAPFTLNTQKAVPVN